MCLKFCLFILQQEDAPPEAEADYEEEDLVQKAEKDFFDVIDNEKKKRDREQAERQNVESDEEKQDQRKVSH